MTVKEKAIKVYQEQLDSESKAKEERERLKFLELKEIFPELEKVGDYRYKIDDLLFYITLGKNYFSDDNELYLRPFRGNFPYTYIRDYAALGKYIIELKEQRELEESDKKIKEKSLSLKEKFFKLFQI